MSYYEDYELQDHAKSDKVKWIIVFTAIVVLLAGDVFDQLLGQGRSAEFAFAEFQHKVGGRTDGTVPVNALVRPEALVLAVDCGIDEALRQFVEGSDKVIGLAVQTLVDHLHRRANTVEAILIVHVVQLCGLVCLAEGEFCLIHLGIDEVFDVDREGTAHDNAGDGTDEQDGDENIKHPAQGGQKNTEDNTEGVEDLPAPSGLSSLL